MIKDKIKSWIKNTINLGVDASDDVNIDIARANYQMYQDELEQQRKDYINSLCNRIKIFARYGDQFIVTASSLNDFMTHEFMMELKEYFEQRGFRVREESDLTSSWLRISWE